MDDIECTRCNDTGYITVRVTYPMSYVCAGSPPDYAKGVTEARCDRCVENARATEGELWQQHDLWQSYNR